MSRSLYNKCFIEMLAPCLLSLGVAGVVQAENTEKNTEAVPAPKVLTVPSLRPAPEDEVAAPVLLKQFGIAPGSVHKIGVGLGVTKFRTIKVGVAGWVSFECIEANNAGWNRGEKYWVNLKTVSFISAPFVSSAASEGQPAKKAPAGPEGR